MVALQATNVIRAVYPARWAGLRDLRAVGAPGTSGWIFPAIGDLAAHITANPAPQAQRAVIPQSGASAWAGGPDFSAPTGGDITSVYYRLQQLLRGRGQKPDTINKPLSTKYLPSPSPSPAGAEDYFGKKS